MATGLLALTRHHHPMLPRCCHRHCSGAFCLIVLLLLHHLHMHVSTQATLEGQDVAALHDLRASLGARASNWPDRADPCIFCWGVACRIVELRRIL